MKCSRCAGRYLLAGCVLIAVNASAVTVLSTPSVTSPTSGGLTCRAVDVGSNPVTVTVDLIASGSGTVVVTTNCTLTTSQQCFVFTSGSPSVGYCKFTVSAGSSKDLRAAISSENGTDTTVVVPATKK
jgi:hypothetical protein